MVKNRLNTLDSIIDTLEEAIKINDIERAKVMVIASKHAIQAHALKYAMKQKVSTIDATCEKLQSLS